MTAAIMIIIWCFYGTTVLMPIVGSFMSIHDLLSKYDISDEIYNVSEAAGDPSAFNSKLTIFEQYAAPDSSVWSICQNCGWRGGAVLFNVSTDVQRFFKNITLSSSQWQEFFLARNDKYYLARNFDEFSKPPAMSYYVVERPVFLLPVITFHPGHILVDLLEGLYHSMVSAYGKVRRDSLIIIDSSNVDERIVLPEVLKYVSSTFASDYKSDKLLQIGSLLQIFTELPLLSVDFLNDISRIDDTVLFRSLHIGVDSRYSYYYKGFRFHPYNIPTNVDSTASMLDHSTQEDCVFVNSSAIIRQLRGPCSDVSSRHRSYSNYLKSSITMLAQQQSRSQRFYPQVLVVQKKRDRVLVDLKAITDVFDRLSLTWEVVDLGNLSFFEQFEYFSRIDILVAAAGTAIHNSIFMRANTTIIFIIEQSWCGWSWMFSNQHRLLNIESCAYCLSRNSTDVAISSDIYRGDLNERLYHYQWTRKSWQQGPRKFKTANLTVTFEGFLQFIGTSCPSLTKYTDQAQTVAVEHESPQASSPNIAHISEVRERDPIVQASVESIAAEVVDDRVTALVIKGELIGDEYLIAALLKSFPYLSICMDIPTFPEFIGFCTTFDTLDYYSSLKMTLSSPIVHVLHFWLQHNPDGGVFQHSDVFLPVDSDRLLHGKPDCFSHLNLVDFPLKLHAECIFSLEDAHDTQQSLSQSNKTFSLTDQYGAAVFYRSWQCSAPVYEQIVISRGMTTAKTSFTDLVQSEISRTCRRNSLSAMECSLLALALYRDAARQQELIQINKINTNKLPARQLLPSSTQPFIFLHIEKSGGSTVREFVVNSSLARRLESFVPCFGDISCLTFDIPDTFSRDSINPSTNRDRNISVVAGHFYWNVWSKLPSCRASSLHNKSECVPSCFVMNRNPITRVISYYYERLYSIRESPYSGRNINSLSAEELESLVTSYRWGRWGNEINKTDPLLVDEGMSDASCRVMAGLKVTAGLPATSEIIQIPPALTTQQIEDALNRLRRCIVGLAEDWMTSVKMINFWFPWIDFGDSYFEVRNIGKNNKKHEDERSLRPELLDVIKRNNMCDMQLYQEAVRRFELQRSVVEASSAYL